MKKAIKSKTINSYCQKKIYSREQEEKAKENHIYIKKRETKTEREREKGESG